MKLKHLLLTATLALTCVATSSYADYCDDTLGEMVGGALEGGLVGTGLGAIADGREGAIRGAQIGAAAGAIDGLIEGEIKRDRCQRDMRDLEDGLIMDELDYMAIEDAIADDIIFND
jgi:outer membrane lipoprotein SlyB